MKRITSFLLIEERLLEAEHFADKLDKVHGVEFGYELNAFLSAARSVTFLLQKEMTKVEGFNDWWKEERRRRLSENSAAKFFLELRNYSQKEGRISFVGSKTHGKQWSYRFTGNSEPVPSELLNRDVAECCHEHVGRLAAAVIACAEAFPYHSCPRRALTPAGLETLGLSIRDAGEIVGFPENWVTLAADLPIEQSLFVLSKCVDAVDFATIQRLADWTAKPTPETTTPS